MSRTVDVLVGRGWVDRKPSESDRRAVEISVTAEGKRVFSEVEAMAVARVSELIEGLTKREKDQLFRGVEILQKSIRMRRGGENGEVLCTD
jgi:DNA-binding MarR family transcriptional regulator